jgi:hypothetical protein
MARRLNWDKKCVSPYSWSDIFSKKESEETIKFGKSGYNYGK